MTSRIDANSPERFHPLGLSLLFGLFYFIQGVSEPTEGLIAQPVLSLLKSWGQNAEQVATFAFLLSLPWSIKPIYGLISDFIPLAGFRRKSYLIVASAVTCASLGFLFAYPLPTGAVDTLLLLLVLPTVGVAFSDVVVDALMVETGQPRGLTGRLQAVQWGTIWGASILTGSLGGYLSQNDLQRWGFLLCGGLTFVTLILGALVVSETRHDVSRDHFTETLAVLRAAMRSRTMLSVAAFLFCWNFNPFSTSVLYLYATRTLGFSEQFYGNFKSLQAAAAMAGSLAYGIYCRRVPLGTLVQLSIVMGVLSTIVYWAMHDEASARGVAIAYGFSMATGSMILLDLAARLCPPRAAGTIFAVLMSLSNLAEGLSTWFGGWCYESWLERFGNPLAYNLLVLIGACFTAGCWLIVPLLHGEIAGEHP